MGMKGVMATSYGQLLRKLWTTCSGRLAPFELRDLVAKFGSTRFTDFEQHDAQEFLAFLLDGLHEDLNRVRVKSYVELKDSDDRADEEVAHEYWVNHINRNSSIIVDLFHGLLRSQVKCSECSKRSVRFDPFNILSLPLPTDHSTYFEVKLMRLDGSKPIRYGFEIPDNGSINLRERLAIEAKLSENDMTFFSVHEVESMIQEFFPINADKLGEASMSHEELIVYPIKIDSEAQFDRPPFINAFHRRFVNQEIYLSPLTRKKLIRFGTSILVWYVSNETGRILSNREVYQHVYQQIRYLTRNVSNLRMRNGWPTESIPSLREDYPFILKYTTEDGKRCSLCDWTRFCYGCTVPLNDVEFHYQKGSLGIEWDSVSYHIAYISNREQDVELHSSVRSKKTTKDSRPLDIQDCIQLFIDSENLDCEEKFYCKWCKTHRSAEKKLDIWKLPPCLIFHIKRFKTANNSWIKSSTKVNFPMRSFYPSKYLAERSSTVSSMFMEKSEHESPSSSEILDSAEQSLAADSDRIEPRLERAFSFGDNSFDVENTSYSLYALVCHYGVINGGHYVAFVKNQADQQWFCFDDSICQRVTEDEIQKCSSSAYLLFYERDSLDYQYYMPNIRDKQPIHVNLPSNNDTSRCSIM